MARAVFPPYYLPPHTPMPKHCGWVGLIGPRQLQPQIKGPDGKSGCYLGLGEFVADSDWRETDAGYWVDFTGITPANFQRLRTVDGFVIDGRDSAHKWLVPQLLRWNPHTRLVCAVDEVLTPRGWEAPRHFRPLMEGLRAMCLGPVDGLPVVQDEEAVQLAIDILALNYHITRAEVTAAEWVTTTFVQRIIEAASGVSELAAAVEAANASKG